MARLIGKAVLTAGTQTLLGTVPQEGATINIRFANRSSDTKVWVWIGTGAAPVDTDNVTPGITVKANTPYEDIGIAADGGEKVWVMAEGAGVTARAHGM